MNKQVVYYVTFHCPGSFVGESFTRDLESADPLRVQWPDNAYAFTMHKRVDVLDGAERFKGTPEQVGPVYYHPASYIQSLEEARSNPAATPILLDNMRINRWAQIIWTRWGNWPQPYEPGKAEILRGGAHG